MAGRKYIAVLATAVFLSGFGGTAQATLIGRLPVTPEGTDYQAYYDTALDITWQANANLALTDTFGLPNSRTLTPGDGEVGSDGRMSWYTAQDWIAAMNAADYLGQSDWRLPGVRPINGLSFNSSYSDVGATDIGVNISAPGTLYAGSTASEMAYLFYNTLVGNVGGYYTGGNPSCITLPVQTFVPSCLQNTGPFSNFLGKYYWSGLARNDTEAWVFFFAEGGQGDLTKETNGSTQPSEGGTHAWAVRDGDITPVPAPGAFWLLGTGIAGLGGRRWLRRKATV